MYWNDSAGHQPAMPSPPDYIRDPAPLQLRTSIAVRFLAPAISLAVLAAAVVAMRGLHFADLVALIPRTPGFWLAFAAVYLAAPVADWVIFRRLWNIPLSGLVPLTRKQIGNELLLGYVGEVYFYAWARRNANITAAPFGAIKDVAVLSALAGNAVTLLMLLAAVPFDARLGLNLGSRVMLLSVATVLLTSIAALLWRKRLLSLPAAELRWIGGIHLARIAVMMGLTALMWHLALPTVALSWWLLLVTMRMLISRLPLVPNKDIVFAGVAAVVVGRDVGIADLMAMMASLILATHVILGLLLTTTEFFAGEAQR